MEMEMSNRHFSERLNQALDDIGVPERIDERIEVFSKLIKIPRFKAEALLNGTVVIDEPLLALITKELEVSAVWLMSKNDKHED